MDPRRWPLGRTNCASAVEYADDDGLPVDPAACGVDAADRRIASNKTILKEALHVTAVVRTIAGINNTATHRKPARSTGRLGSPMRCG